MTERLLTRTELAQITGLSLDTIDRRREEGMPCLTLGARSVRFRLSDCLPWLEQYGRKERSEAQSA